jgi:hypothetical protein
LGSVFLQSCGKEFTIAAYPGRESAYIAFMSTAYFRRCRISCYRVTLLSSTSQYDCCLPFPCIHEQTMQHCQHPHIASNLSNWTWGGQQSCCEVYGVALFVARANTAVGVSPETFLLLLLYVHKCMKVADAAVVAAARQQTR